MDAPGVETANAEGGGGIMWNYVELRGTDLSELRILNFERTGIPPYDLYCCTQLEEMGLK